MRLIALFGPKCAGKDESARALQDLYQRESSWAAWRLAFVDPIRWACDGLGLPDAATREAKDEPCSALDGHPGRALLVGLGAAVRSLAPDYFVRHAIERARDLGGLVVITDGRRENEARIVREAGGVCAWMHRPEAHARAAEDVVLESAVHGMCDFEVRNTGDLAHLRAECRRLLDFALSRPEVSL